MYQNQQSRSLTQYSTIARSEVETEDTKKFPIKSVELKTIIFKRKNTQNGINSRINTAKAKITKVEDGIMSKALIYLQYADPQRMREADKIFEKIIVNIFLTMEKEIYTDPRNSTNPKHKKYNKNYIKVYLTQIAQKQ